MNTIKITYNAKTKRLLLAVPFHLADVARSFPSRRFDPKTKLWAVPIVKQNLAHWLEIRKKYDWDLSTEAISAMMDAEKLMQGPSYIPFPLEFFDGAKYSPMEHQWPMLDRGWNLRGYALFAAMGTGKTFVTVQMGSARWKYGEIGAMVVISPQTLHRTWQKEFAKYAPPDSFTTRPLKTGDKGLDEWMSTDPGKLHILLISVEGLGISEKYYLESLRFYEHFRRIFTVVDESSRIKNPDAKRTERTIMLGSFSEYRMILNGTPIAKGIQDLWSQYEFLDPNIIGSGDYWAFKTRYVEMGGYENKQIIGYKNVEELMRLIQPYSLEVDKKVLKLPPKIPKQRYLSPTPEQQRLFEKILTGVGDGPMIKVQNVLERMLRLQQVIGGFEPMTDPETLVTTVRPLSANPKFDDLIEFIEDVKASSKVIIWARYQHEIEFIVASLRKKYGDRSVLHYYGGTDAAGRAEAEDRYRDDPELRFVVGNPAAAGLGLTFISPENDVMYYYSGTFAYIDRSQSEERGHRIGQTDTVTVVDPIIEGTLDEAMFMSIAEKKDMDQFVKDWVAKGNNLHDLFRGKVQ